MSLISGIEIFLVVLFFILCTATVTRNNDVSERILQVFSVVVFVIFIVFLLIFDRNESTLLKISGITVILSMFIEMEYLLNGITLIPAAIFFFAFLRTIELI